MYNLTSFNISIHIAMQQTPPPITDHYMSLGNFKLENAGISHHQFLNPGKGTWRAYECRDVPCKEEVPL